ncbi:MAG: hypothetical protein KDC61_20335, partial [Saprospiraceae bacterium]|nr:hypothetical protein [Saprospiraceae bacterium]
NPAKIRTAKIALSNILTQPLHHIFFGEPTFAYPQNTPFVKSGRKDKDFCYTAKKYFKKINRRHIGGDGVWKNTGH